MIRVRAAVPAAFSLLRLPLALAIDFFAFHGKIAFALAALAVFFATDFLDGFLARRLGAESETGKVLDSGIDYAAVMLIIPPLAAQRARSWLLLFALEIPLLIIGLYYFRRLASDRSMKGTALGKPHMTIAVAASYLALVSGIFWQWVVTFAALLWCANIALFLQGKYRKAGGNKRKQGKRQH